MRISNRWGVPGDESLRMIVETVQQFGREKLRPAYAQCEEEGLFPYDTIQDMAGMGLFGLMIPEVYGGSGLGTIAASYVARALAYEWGSAHLIWSANSSLAAYPIMCAGNETQKGRILPRLSSGEVLGCYALTEPNAGSDALSMKLRAVQNLTTREWTLNGSKTFITNPADSSVMVVFARTGVHQRAIAAFVIETEKPGLVYPGITVNPIKKRILKSSHFAEVHFNNVVLSADALLGAEMDGFSIAMRTLDGGRINIAAQAIGMAERIFDEAFEYVQVRETFGRPVWNNQAVQFDFANARTSLKAAWALVKEVSEQRDRGEDITETASCAKLFATETATDVARKLGDYFGAMGYVSDTSYLPRKDDIEVTRTYEGASNIQRMVIAKHLARS